MLHRRINMLIQFDDAPIFHKPDMGKRNIEYLW